MRASWVVTFSALLIGLLSTSCSFAQSAKMREAFAKGPHTGPIEQAIVGVTTRFTDRHSQVLEERHGCGIVLRCDGFVLFSAAMLDHREDEPEDVRPTIQITIRPGTPEEQTVEAPWPKTTPTGISLRMVKLADTHIPALRTLLPDALKSGNELTIAWLPWDITAHRFGPLQRRMLHCASPVLSGKVSWLSSLQEPADEASPGTIVLGPDGMAMGMVTARSSEDRRQYTSMEALARVTNCVVPVPMTDAEFALRNKTSAEPPAQADAAAPAADAENPPKPPAPDEDQNGANPSPASTGMVKVPGGPVVLPKAIGDVEIELEHAKIACVPSFEIDRYEVTNEEYWNFWSHLPAKTSAEQAARRQYWPVGWADTDTPFPADVARTPVLGVPLAGARAYARALGKRLPTPYEWALAALGPDGDTKAPDWMAQYISDTNTSAQRVKQQHIAFLKQYPDVHGDDFLYHATRLHNMNYTKVKVGRSWVPVNADQRVHGADFMDGLPWIISPLLGFVPELNGSGGFFDALNGIEGLDMPLRLKMQMWSKGVIEGEARALWDKWKAPFYVLPVGSRSFDLSPYGAADMLWNGAELVAPAPAGGGADGYAVSTTFLRPKDGNTLNEALLVTGPSATGLVENFPNAVAYPLSRLIARTQPYPLAQWLWFQSNWEETRAMIRLISGWQVNMLPAVSTVDIPTDNHSPFVGPVFYDDFPLYQEWSKPSKHMRNEIGSAVPLPTGEPLPSAIIPRESGATLRFLIPIGFRCAR